MPKYIDIENATLSWEEAYKQGVGDDFMGGVLFALEALTAKEEDIVRCKDCVEHQRCDIERRLGWYGYCSFGARKDD